MKISSLACHDDFTKLFYYDIENTASTFAPTSHITVNAITAVLEKTVP
jgi:hypothetical protein